LFGHDHFERRVLLSAVVLAGPEAKGGGRKVPVKFFGVPEKFTMVESLGD
jgi:hypothetical protein